MDRIAMLQAMEVWHQALYDIAMRDDCPREIRALASIAVAQGSAFVVSKQSTLDRCAIIIDAWSAATPPEVES